MLPCEVHVGPQWVHLPVAQAELNVIVAETSRRMRCLSSLREPGRRRYSKYQPPFEYFRLSCCFISLRGPSICQITNKNTPCNPVKRVPSTVSHHAHPLFDFYAAVEFVIALPMKTTSTATNLSCVSRLLNIAFEHSRSCGRKYLNCLRQSPI
jgi:hypothetical protein